MNPWIALLVFFCSVGDDLLYVYFVRRVIKGDKLMAAALSGILTAVVSFEGYWQYSQNIGYAVANALGSAVGCPLAIWLEDRQHKKKKKPPRIRYLPVKGDS